MRSRLRDRSDMELFTNLTYEGSMRVWSVFLLLVLLAATQSVSVVKPYLPQISASYQMMVAGQGSATQDQIAAKGIELCCMKEAIAELYKVATCKADCSYVTAFVYIEFARQRLHYDQMDHRRADRAFVAGLFRPPIDLSV